MHGPAAPQALYLTAVTLLGLLLLPAAPASAQRVAGTDLEAFDGSFRLESGEVVTGGYMVEGGKRSWLFMDTEGLARGGLFERAGDTLRSIIPPDGAVSIEFRRGSGNEYMAGS